MGSLAIVPTKSTRLGVSCWLDCVDSVDSVIHRTGQFMVGKVGKAGSLSDTPSLLYY